MFLRIWLRNSLSYLSSTRSRKQSNFPHIANMADSTCESLALTGSLRHFTPTSCTSNNSFIASHSRVKNDRLYKSWEHAEERRCRNVSQLHQWVFLKTTQDDHYNIIILPRLGLRLFAEIMPDSLSNYSFPRPKFLSRRKPSRVN